MNKAVFYLLSFTWGLPTTIAGCVAAAGLRLTGHRSKKWGYCRYFEYGGEHWGGMSLGIFFFKDRSDSVHIKNHEHGHAIQNCYFGPLMPFLVAIPSFTRYHYREFRAKHHHPPRTSYDAVWFEAQATRMGTKLVNKIYDNEKGL